jgi:hypothetical protein
MRCITGSQQAGENPKWVCYIGAREDVGDVTAVDVGVAQAPWEEQFHAKDVPDGRGCGCGRGYDAHSVRK